MGEGRLAERVFFALSNQSAPHTFNPDETLNLNSKGGPGLPQPFNVVKLSATDVLAPTTMKNAAKCDTSCDLQNPVNHQNFERILRFRDTPGSMLVGVSVDTTRPRLLLLFPLYSSAASDVYKRQGSGLAIIPREPGIPSKHRS